MFDPLLIPDSTWNLPDLAEFIHGILKLTTAEMWRIGTALNLAKKKHPRKFKKWCEQFQFGLATSTIYRYRKVASTMSLSECEGHGITECQVKAGVQQKKARPRPAVKAPAVHSESEQEADHDEPEATEGQEMPSWAVKPKHSAHHVIEAVRHAFQMLAEYEGEHKPMLLKEVRAISSLIAQKFLKETNG
jgi:hypothetical protein